MTVVWICLLGVEFSVLTFGFNFGICCLSVLLLEHYFDLLCADLITFGYCCKVCVKFCGILWICLFLVLFVVLGLFLVLTDCFICVYVLMCWCGLFVMNDCGG